MGWAQTQTHNKETGKAMRMNLDQETLGVKSVSAVTPMMSFVNAEDRARGVEPTQEKTKDGRLRWELHCHVVKTDAGFPESEVFAIRVATLEGEPVPEVGEYGSPVFLSWRVDEREPPSLW